MSWQPYPRLPFIQFIRADGGGFFAKDTRSGQEVFASNMDGVHRFAADNSRGLGTAVHRVTSALGFDRCGACAARQAAMNGLFRRR